MNAPIIENVRGIRNRNPGNIELSPVAWVGQIPGVDGRFCTFEHAIFGLRAIGKVLLVYHHRRIARDGSAIDTVGEIVDRWAPPSENDTAAYAAHIRDLLDVETGQIIDPDDIEVLQKLVAGIVHHECGSQPYPDHWLRLACELAKET